MSEFIAFDGQTLNDGEGGFAGPLPDGTRVLAHIMPTRKDAFTIDRRPYAKQGDNARFTALAVRFAIAPDQVGAGRNLFANVALTRKFASGNKNGMLGDFFGSVGVDVNNPNGFAVPEDNELLGSPVTLVLGIEENDKGEFVNFVRFVNKPSAGTPKGTKLPEVVLPKRRGQQQGAQAPAAQQQGWAPSAPPQAAAVAAQQPAAWNPVSEAPLTSADVWSPSGATAKAF